MVEVIGRLIKPRIHSFEQEIREALEVAEVRFEFVELVFRVYL
ncbi:hypothetical protein Hsw_0449 [Hymenobacter swuensis DY53]|uniref:Uncharacterized protein n=1 Tax=Hymenobacter swuensis DY53 TaxID=1227739 RepID=W8ESC4_9BACT|nr:hypothetical protein Hsw_0449 [Hymenobacter swuensis DY53]